MMTEPEPPYPPIDPTHFDLIVIGTGLPESIIAAAASTAGHSVLHVDPNPHYGSHYSSLNLHHLTHFLTSPNPNPNPLYSHTHITVHHDSVTQQSNKFNLDLCGPRVLFCADVAVDLLLRSTANQYVEFKNIDGSFVCGGDGKVVSVPDSKSALFKDRTLSYIEKNQLNKLFKKVQEHLEGAEVISDEELDSPFVAFLDGKKLSPKIKSIILYAIAMVDYDQDVGESCKDVLSTRDGIDRLALYHSSVGRFPNALGALIYPIYGQGELPQAFCRRAAVKGCLYVLRMPVISVLLHEDSGNYKGVKLVSGQEITSNKLVIDPSFSIASSPSEALQDVSKVFDVGTVTGKVARGICITKSSIKADASNCLVIYPPRSLYPDQATSIRVLQLSSDLAVCPSGMFVIYISVVCDDALEGKKSLDAAIDRLFSAHTSATTDSGSPDQSESTEVKPTGTDQSESTEVKPALLWSALYIQDLIEGGVMGPVVRTPTPDGNLNYNNLLHATLKLYQKLYPDDDELFPETVNTDSFDKLEDDSEVGIESP